MARWLLMAHDRSDSDELTMIHEFLSMMLGVRRSGVTVAAGALEKAGVIRHKPGTIIVVDREGLEAAACECYAAVQREYVRLLSGSGGRRPSSGRAIRSHARPDGMVVGASNARRLHGR